MKSGNEATKAEKYEWHYTCEVLEGLYEGFAKAAEAGNPDKEDAWLAMAAGYALGLMEIAKDIPDRPIELDLVGPTDPNDMALVATFAAIVFQGEGLEAVRAKLSIDRASPGCGLSRRNQARPGVQA